MKMNKQTQKALAATVGGLVIAAFFGSVVAATPARAAMRPKAAQAADVRTSFHFSNIPVRSALQMIAEQGGFNLVVSDSVQGTVSLSLKDVTWAEALEVVMRLKGLRMRVDSTTLSVTGAGG